MGCHTAVVLTLAYCVVPTGESECQDRSGDLIFNTEEACIASLDEKRKLFAEIDTATLYSDKSKCEIRSRHRDTRLSREEELRAAQARVLFIYELHQLMKVAGYTN